MDAKTLCLGILIQGDATGYEIRKAFEDGPFQHFFDVGYGSIYPALTKLADDGLVSFRTEAQAGRPDKKVYSMTPAGRLAFIESLAEPPSRDKLRSEFLFMLSFAPLLSARHVGNVIEWRLAEVQTAIEHMESGECSPTDPCHAFVHGYGLAIYRAIAEYLETNGHVPVREALMAEATPPTQPAPAGKVAQTGQDA